MVMSFPSRKKTVSTMLAKDWAQCSQPCLGLCKTRYNSWRAKAWQPDTEHHHKASERAVMSNQTAAEMKRGIYASLNHCFSTDDNPCHSLCPTWEDSWCFFLINHLLYTRCHTIIENSSVRPSISPECGNI